MDKINNLVAFGKIYAELQIDNKIAEEMLLCKNL